MKLITKETKKDNKIYNNLALKLENGKYIYIRPVFKDDYKLLLMLAEKGD